MPALRRYRHVLIIVIIGAMAGGALAVYLLADRDNTAGRTPSTTSDPPITHAVTTTQPAEDVALRKLAERYVDAVNRADDETVTQLNCAARTGLTQVAADGKPVRLAGDLEWSPNRDRAYFSLTIDGEPTGRLRLELRNGTWCVRD